MKLRPQKRVVFAGKTPITDYESYSSLALFAKCPVLFYERYFSRVKEPGTPELLLGAAVHSAIEDALIERRMGGAFAVEWLVERFRILWSVELFLAKGRPEGVAFKAGSPAKYEAAGAELVRRWHAERLPSIRPELVEHPFNIAISGSKRSLYGKIDLVMRGDVIVDHKTTGRPFELLRAGVTCQFGVYFAAYAKEFDRWPRGEVHVLSTKGAGTSVEPMDLDVDSVQAVLDGFVRPNMKAVDAAWERQLFPCKCGKHKDAAVLPDDYIGGRKPASAGDAPSVAEAVAASARAAQEMLEAREAERKLDIDPADIPF